MTIVPNNIQLTRKLFLEYVYSNMYIGDYTFNYILIYYRYLQNIYIQNYIIFNLSIIILYNLTLCIIIMEVYIYNYSV